MHVTRLAVQSDNTSGECHILATARRMTEALADQLVISREQGIERLSNAMCATVQPGQPQRVIRGRNQRGYFGHAARSGEAQITSMFPSVAHGSKAGASFMFAGCCRWRSLAGDGNSGTSRGHRPVMRRRGARRSGGAAA
jgi:hypothetical protein